MKILPKRRVKALWRSASSFWSRKKMTQWSSSALRMSPMVPSSRSSLTSTLWISAPMLPAMGRTSIWLLRIAVSSGLLLALSALLCWP